MSAGVIADSYVATSAFKPTTFLTGLRLWVSAQEITGLSDSGQISTWNDLSGNNFHLTGVAGSGGAKPLYRTTAGSGGGPAVQFQSGNANQVGGYFTIPAGVFTGLTAGAAWTIVKSAQGQTTLWQLGPAGAGSGHFPFDDVIYEDAFVTARATYVGTFTGGLNQWRRYLTSMSGGTQKAYRDGTLLNTNARTFGLPTTPKFGGGPAYNLAGHSSSLIIIDHEPTSGERADLETWGAANPSGGLP